MIQKDKETIRKETRGVAFKKIGKVLCLAAIMAMTLSQSVTGVVAEEKVIAPKKQVAEQEIALERQDAADKITWKKETEEEIPEEISEEERIVKVQKKKKLAWGESFSLKQKGEKIIFCKTSKKKVVAVSQTGTVHALKPGRAKVTVKSTDSEKTFIRTYTITVKKSGMVYPVFSMMKGEHLDLQFTQKKKHVKWKSSNPSVARVSKTGRVKALKKGKAMITGKTKDGKVYRCNLKVTKKISSVIYLTFDDGPNRYSTTKILNILKKNNVKATFFELKPAQKDFDLTKRVIQEGHTLALHGYQHKYDIIYQSEKVYHQNLDKLRNLFFKKFGVWSTVTRFPGGSSNKVSRYNPGIMTRLTKKLDDWGYHYFDWNVESCDAGGAKNSQETFSNFQRGLRKGRGNVVLMHDFANNDKTINALDRMIKYGKANGYTFLPITASTSEVHHTVNN